MVSKPQKWSESIACFNVGITRYFFFDARSTPILRIDWYRYFILFYYYYYYNFIIILYIYIYFLCDFIINK